MCNRLLTGLLLGPAVGLSGGVSAGPENGVGQAEQLSATHLYLALHLQHYTGVCGDTYAAAGARTPSSLCLDHAQTVSGKRGKLRHAGVIVFSEGAN